MAHHTLLMICKHLDSKYRFVLCVFIIWNEDNSVCVYIYYRVMNSYIHPPPTICLTARVKMISSRTYAWEWVAYSFPLSTPWSRILNVSCRECVLSIPTLKIEENKYKATGSSVRCHETGVHCLFCQLFIELQTKQNSRVIDLQESRFYSSESSEFYHYSLETLKYLDHF